MQGQNQAGGLVDCNQGKTNQLHIEADGGAEDALAGEDEAERRAADQEQKACATLRDAQGRLDKADPGRDRGRRLAGGCKAHR